MMHKLPRFRKPWRFGFKAIYILLNDLSGFAKLPFLFGKLELPYGLTQLSYVKSRWVFSFPGSVR
jgi:hypothetical protein